VPGTPAFFLWLTRVRYQDLRLKEEGREMIYKGPLKRRGGSQGDSGELLVFLLDHALLMVKQKNKAEQYKVYRPVRFVPLLNSPDSISYTAVAHPARASPRHRYGRIWHAPDRLVSFSSQKLRRER
jgi:Pleckstrin homology domain